VGVDDQQPAEAAAVQPAADLHHLVEQRARVQAQRAGESAVLDAGAEGQRGQRVGRHRLGQPRQRAADHGLGDERVHRTGQVRAMLLDGAHRPHHHRLLARRQRRQLGRAQVGQESRGRHVAMEHAANLQEAPPAHARTPPHTNADRPPGRPAPH
jgi:hypothetical protein